VCLGAGGLAAVTAAIVIPADLRWSLVVPAIPALSVSGAMIAGREKSWYGETAAAFAFAGVTVPVALGAGATAAVAAAVAIPFAFLFTTTTLAVRVVVLRVRGGGDPGAVTATRRATFAVAALAIVLIGILTMAGRLAPSVLAASAPGLVTAVFVAARPPSPTRLRVLGWSLVAVSALTAVIVVTMA
jgi:hypothetical protein